MTLEDLMQFRLQAERVSGGYSCTVQYTESLSKEERFEQQWFAFAWEGTKIPFNAYSRVSAEDCIRALATARVEYIQHLHQQLDSAKEAYDRTQQH